MTAVSSPDRPGTPARLERAIDSGWEAASTDPDAVADPAGLDAVSWLPARVPGSAAGVIVASGEDPGAVDLDARDWWFRTRFDADPAGPGEEVLLHLDGIATIAEVYLNGARVAVSESMFVAQSVDVGDRLAASNELAIVCRALTPRLAEVRRPRARWRTRVVADGNLRWFRTMILGRAPGFAPGPALVGPWRPVRLERRRRVALDDVRLRTRVDAVGDGWLDVHARVRTLGGRDGPSPLWVEVRLDGPNGRHALRLDVEPDGDVPNGQVVRGVLRIPMVARWWPHTHGNPALHAVSLAAGAGPDDLVVDAGNVGFRTVAAGPGPDHDLERDGLDLHINGERIFARGAVWTPEDWVGFAPSPDGLRRTLGLVRDAGMNMLRIPGTGAYESSTFHDLCDELGILVWQDFMFANLDYPFVDEEFQGLVRLEATQVLDRITGHPSTVVLCGNSEVEQQVAMLGLPPELGRDPFYRLTLPALARAAGADAIDVPSAPFGGDLPFRPDRGVANYYGVGGYRRPLSDARTSGVRFAAECLALANVPDDVPADIRAGVPRDVRSDWDFQDVRDHYLALLFEVDPEQLRLADRERYLELSRAVSGEVMAEVFGEWRRAGSPSGGGLVLWLRDLDPGSGWGLLDHRGEPKVAWHHLRRVLAPTAVWTTDEGLGGVVVHVANDGPAPLTGRLRVALYRDLEVPVGGGETIVDLVPRGTVDHDVEALVGHFVDAAWAYRFGPPAQDLIVATLEGLDGPIERPLAQAVRLPAGRAVATTATDDLGLAATIVSTDGDRLLLAVSTRRLAYGVRIGVPGFMPSDDAFAIEPGHTRHIELRSRHAGTPFAGGALRAFGLASSIPIAI